MHSDSALAADLPFYRGEPVLLSGRQWALLLLLCLSGFLALILLGMVFTGPFSQLIPATLFVGLPVLGLAAINRKCVTALFRPLSLRAVLLMPSFALLNLFVSVLVALLVASTFEVSPNPAAGMIREFSDLEFVAFLLRTLPQLVGEEVISILPFLALLTYLVQARQWPKARAVLVAWLVTALLFGALHLPTYQWNVAQSFIIIGAARMVLTAAYLATGNIWVCSGAHILSDWLIFVIAFFAPEEAFEGLQ